MDDLVLLGHDERQMRMDTVTRKMKWKCPEYQFMHNLSLVYFEVKVGLVESKPDKLVSTCPTNNKASSYVPPVRQVLWSIVRCVETISTNQRHGIRENSPTRCHIDAEPTTRHWRLGLLSYEARI